MVNLAELDTAFLVPCKHCAELLQEHERICPFCGEDQSIADDADDAGDASSEPEREPGTSAAAEAPAPLALESALTPPPTAQELIGHPVPASAANEEGKAELGLVRPGNLWQKDVLGGSGGPAHWARSSLNRNRLVIGIAAALVLVLLLAVVHDHFYADKQSEAGKPQEFRPNVEQVQEQAAKPEPPADAGLTASEALGLGAPAAPPAPAPSPPQAPIIANPAPATGAAAPQEKECNETLAALALCSNR